MEICEYSGENFKVIKSFEGWKIGALRYGDRFAEYKNKERHLLTDECFVLLEGEATLYENDLPHKMEKCKIYNIKKGVWHNIVVSPDATVLVIENSNTSPENTERINVL